MKRGWKGIGMIAVAALLWSMQGVLGKANTWGFFFPGGRSRNFCKLRVGMCAQGFPDSKETSGLDWRCVCGIDSAVVFVG